MKLATADDVLTRMKLENMVGAASTSSIDSALESATTMIESILRTPLAETTRIDYFDNTRGVYEGYTPQTIYLTQRYLTSATVEVYNTAVAGDNLDDITELTALDSSYYYVNKEEGSIRILGDLFTAYAGIAVKYVAGFTEGGTIPEWLSESAISAAILTQHTQAITHAKKDAPKMTAPLSGLLYTNLNEHIYTPYDGIYPIRAVVV